MPAPKRAYDVVIVGGGGHGLATAYYLAKEHGITNVAVLEKGWIGSGNAGRNTTIIRSNYLLPGNIAFYEWSMKLWEGLERDLNYNTMVSQRGVHQHLSFRRAARRLRPPRQRHAAARRRCANCSTASDVRAMLPFLDYDNARFPIHGGLLQRRGGTARHDAVVWGYARAADRRGVDIIQNCEVTGIRASRTGRVDRRRNDARRHPRQEDRRSRSPATTSRRRGDGRACGCRSRATCCRLSCPRASSR